MNDRVFSFSISRATAIALWVAVPCLLLAGWLLSNVYIAHIGLATSAAAATASIRRYHVNTDRMIRRMIAVTLETHAAEDEARGPLGGPRRLR